MTSAATSQSILPERPFRRPLGGGRVLHHGDDPSLDPGAWQVLAVFSHHYPTLAIGFDGIEFSRNSTIGPVVVVEADDQHTLGT